MGFSQGISSYDGKASFGSIRTLWLKILRGICGGTANWTGAAIRGRVLENAWVGCPHIRLLSEGTPHTKQRKRGGWCKGRSERYAQSRPILLLHHLRLLGGQQRLEGCDQLQVAGGRDVVVLPAQPAPLGGGEGLRLRLQTLLGGKRSVCPSVVRPRGKKSCRPISGGQTNVWIIKKKPGYPTRREKL